MTVDELDQLKLVSSLTALLTHSIAHSLTLVLMQIGSGHLAHQHYEEEEMGAPATKKRRVKGTRVERPRGVAAHFRQTDVSDVQEVWLGIHVVPLVAIDAWWIISH